MMESDSKTATEFVRFSDLPPEMRTKIWEFSAASPNPRVLEVTHSRGDYISPGPGLKSQTNHSLALLMTNRESHVAVMRVFPDVLPLGPPASRRGVRFNKDRDVVLISSMSYHLGSDSVEDGTGECFFHIVRNVACESWNNTPQNNMDCDNHISALLHLRKGFPNLALLFTYTRATDIPQEFYSTWAAREDRRHRDDVAMPEAEWETISSSLRNRKDDFSKVIFVWPDLDATPASDLHDIHEEFVHNYHSIWERCLLEEGPEKLAILKDINIWPMVVFQRRSWSRFKRLIAEDKYYDEWDDSEVESDASVYSDDSTAYGEPEPEDDPEYWYNLINGIPNFDDDEDLEVFDSSLEGTEEYSGEEDDA